MSIQCSCGDVLNFISYKKAMDWLDKHFNHKEGIIIDDFKESKEHKEILKTIGKLRRLR